MIVQANIQTKCQKINLLCLLTMENKEFKKIGVIGCGWLGLPLAKFLSDSGYAINGSTTSPEKLNVLKQNNIVPFLIQLGDTGNATNLNVFLDVDLLIINIPPGRASNSADTYLDKLSYLKSEIANSPIKKIIFISSTSVYAESNGIHTENSESFGTEASQIRLRKAENLFTNLPNIETTVIRMAGLIGPERHPGRFFSGKKDIPNGLSPVNLIHLDDCIGIIYKVIADGLWNDIVNGAAPTHPTKMKFYDLASVKLYGKHAEFIMEKLDFKIIDGNKIISKGYQFKHPDLLGWLQQDPQN